MKGIVSLIEVGIAGIILMVAFLHFFPKYSIRSNWDRVLLFTKVKDTLNVIDNMNKTYEFATDSDKFNNFMKNVFSPEETGVIIWWKQIKGLDESQESTSIPHFTQAQKATIVDVTDKIFEDDFESGNLTKWTIADSGWDIVTDIVKQGSYAAKGVDSSTSDAPDLIKDLSNYSYGIYQGWFRFAENNSWHYPAIPSTTPNGASLYAVVAKNDGHFGYYDKDAGIYKNYPIDTTYTSNIWYNITLKWDSGTFWVWIDGELKTPNGITVSAYDGNPWTGIDKLRILPSASSTTGTMWIDDIKVKGYRVYSFTLGLGYPY